MVLLLVKVRLSWVVEGNEVVGIVEECTCFQVDWEPVKRAVQLFTLDTEAFSLDNPSER